MKIIKKLMVIALFIGLSLNFNIKAQASTHLSKGNIFYDANLKYKVTQAGTDSEKGSVQVLGINPDYYKRDATIGVSINATAYFNETGEEFYVTSVKSGAFKNKKKIVVATAHIYDEHGVKQIPANCFSGCTRLKYFGIGGYCTSVGKNAVKGCTKLISFVVQNPKGKIDIKSGAFKGTKKVELNYYDDEKTMPVGYVKTLAKLVKKRGAKKVVYTYNYRKKTI